MRRSLFVLLVVAVLGSSGAALAETSPKPAAVHHARAEKKWPMSADRFRAEIENRIGRSREKLERAIEKRKLSAAKAQARRADFFAAVSHLRKRVATATQDGIVTRDEAREVRDLSRQLGRGRR